MFRSGRPPVRPTPRRAVFAVEALEDRLAPDAALVHDIRSGVGSSIPTGLMTAGGVLFFAADDGSAGRELWKRDGAATPVLVKDGWGGSSGSNPRHLTAVGTTVYFAADDGTNGVELWRSNGTGAGTVMVANLNGFPTAGASSSPDNLTSFNGLLYFRADDGLGGTGGRVLWRSDGTGTGTRKVTVLDGSSTGVPSELTVAGNTLFFAGGGRLWKLDGSGNARFADPAFLNPTSLAAVGNDVYFVANAGNGVGGEVWRSNGQVGGTVLVKDPDPPNTAPSPANLTALGSDLFFTADDGASGTELWVSNGTANGTGIVRDIRPGTAGSNPSDLTAVGKALYFTADGSGGRELWKSDGSAAGTVRVADIRPGTAGSDPANLTVVNGVLYFTADDGVNGRQVWRTDGTAAGTVRLAAVPAGEVAHTGPLVYLAGELFFVAGTATAGAELWKLSGPTITSDGGGNAAGVGVAENTTAVTTVAAAVLDSAAVAYSVAGGADAAKFTINSTTGALAFVTAPDFEAPTDANSDNVYEVVVSASDGKATDTQAVSVAVTDQPHTLAAVYVDDDWAALAVGTTIADADPSVAGSQPAAVGTTAFGVVERAIDAVLPGGTVVLNAGTYTQAAVLAAPTTVKVTGTATIGGGISGPGGLVKAGNGVLTLSGANTHTGGTDVVRGELRVASDGALGAPTGGVAVEAPGTLVVNGSFTSSRVFDLNQGAVRVSPGFTLTLLNAEVSGGFLTGDFATPAGGATTFTGTTTAPSSTLALSGSDTLGNVNHGGQLTTNAGATVTLSTFFVQPSGRVTVASGAAVTVQDFQSSGQLNVNGTGVVSRTGPSPMVLGGGSTTFLGSQASRGGTINLNGGTLQVRGGLLVNAGLTTAAGGVINGQTVVDYGGLAKGDGFYADVVAVNGGKISGGFSPGTLNAGTFNINGGGTLGATGGVFVFELTGPGPSATFPTAPGTPGGTPGWDTVAAATRVRFTATPTDKFTVALVTLDPAAAGDTPAQIPNFDPSRAYSWLMVSNPTGAVVDANGNPTTINPAAIAIDASEFKNPTAGGTFGITVSGDQRQVFLTFTPAPPQATGVLVNGTTAPASNVTTSRLTSLRVTFNSIVSAVDPGAFTLTRGATTLLSGGAISVAGLGTSALTLTFTGTTGVEFGSLADGIWTLTTDLSKVRNAAGAAGSGTTTTNNVRRLFGDGNGDGLVNLTDFGLFGNTFGKGSAAAGFNPAFDHNGDGVINLTDFGAFGQRFGKGL